LNRVFYGGTFDPFHKGHKNILQYCFRKLKADKAYLIPTYINPEKDELPSSSDKRIDLIKLANIDIDYEIIDYEINNRRPSYTYQTIQYLKQEKNINNSNDFFIIGSDNLETLNEWQNIDEIIKSIKIVCFKRNNTKLTEKQTINAQKYNVLVLKNKIIDISATEIRKKLSYKWLTNKQVNYINQNYMYHKNILRQFVDKDRYNHCIRTMQRAIQICENYKFADSYKAIYASLYHDIAKQVDRNNHDKLGAKYLKKYLLVKDKEILSAVRHHTKAKYNMTDLQKIVYLADKTESERDYKGLDKINSVIFKDLDLAYKYAFVIATESVLNSNEKDLVSKKDYKRYIKIKGEIKW
jgi:nicotinate-nucleotide adenylyltransferase